MSKYIYIGNEEFSGSIRGVIRYLKPGDTIYPEDVPYFLSRYPSKVAKVVEENYSEVHPDITRILSEQSKKIDKLLDLIDKSYIDAPLARREGEGRKSVSIDEISTAKLVKIDTSDIQHEGTAGEAVKKGSPVLKKVESLKKVLKK